MPAESTRVGTMDPIKWNYPSLRVAPVVWTPYTRRSTPKYNKKQLRYEYSLVTACLVDLVVATVVISYDTAENPGFDSLFSITYWVLPSGITQWQLSVSNFAE